jgi:hypothetical protein
LLTFAAAYLLAIASTAGTELVYAALFGLAATALIAALQRADGRTFRLTPRAALVLFGRAVAGGVTSSRLLLGPRLWAQLSGRAPEGRFIRIGIEPGDGGPESAGRVAATLWVQAFTPNTIPLFVDRGYVVLHQLVRRREPSAGDREFPA